MSALEQLDRVRRESVERARQVRRDAKDAAQKTEAALQAALSRQREAERRAVRARADYAVATSVLDLRAAELQLAHAAREQRECLELRLRCERAHAEARTALCEHERALLDAELGRRAVERRLTQQAADVGRRTEQRREEEAEDAFRVTGTR